MIHTVAGVADAESGVNDPGYSAETLVQ